MKIIKHLIEEIYYNPKEGLYFLKLLFGVFISLIGGLVFFGCQEGYKICKIKTERKANDFSGYWKRISSAYTKRFG